MKLDDQIILPVLNIVLLPMLVGCNNPFSDDASVSNTVPTLSLTNQNNLRDVTAYNPNDWISGSDADGDSLTYSWDPQNDGSFESISTNYKFSDAGLFGNLTVPVRVTDGKDTTTKNLELFVDENDGPVVDSQNVPNGTYTSAAGATISLSYNWSDPESDTMTNFKHLRRNVGDTNWTEINTSDITNNEGRNYTYPGGSVEYSASAEDEHGKKSFAGVVRIDETI